METGLRVGKVDENGGDGVLTESLGMFGDFEKTLDDFVVVDHFLFDVRLQRQTSQAFRRPTALVVVLGEEKAKEGETVEEGRER